MTFLKTVKIAMQIFNFSSSQQWNTKYTTSDNLIFNLL